MMKLLLLFLLMPVMILSEPIDRVNCDSDEYQDIFREIGVSFLKKNTKEPVNPCGWDARIFKTDLPNWRHFNTDPPGCQGVHCLYVGWMKEDYCGNWKVVGGLVNHVMGDEDRENVVKWEIPQSVRTPHFLTWVEWDVIKKRNEEEERIRLSSTRAKSEALDEIQFQKYNKYAKGLRVWWGEDSSESGVVVGVTGNLTNVILVRMSNEEGSIEEILSGAVYKSRWIK